MYNILHESKISYLILSIYTRTNGYRTLDFFVLTQIVSTVKYYQIIQLGIP